MGIVHVFAVISAQPGKRDELLRIFQANVPAVHAEDGCIEYRAVIDLEGAGSFQSALGPDTFAVVEKWTTMEALAAHAAAPHMKAYGEAAKGLLASRTIHVLRDA